MSRILLSVPLVAVLLFSGIVRADLVLTNAVGDGQFVAASSGGSSPDSDQDTVGGFPTTNTLNAHAGFPGASASVTYAYSQTGGVTSLAWTDTLGEDGIQNSYGSHDAIITFSVTGTDQTFTWSSESSVLGARGSPSYFANLYDNTTHGYVFQDTGVAGLLVSATPSSFQLTSMLTDDIVTTIFPEHTGILTAGHSYTLSTHSIVTVTGTVIPLNSISVDGSFNFTATDSVSTVPEPTSLALVGMGSLGIFAGAVRRRRLGSIAVTSSKAI